MSDRLLACEHCRFWSADSTWSDTGTCQRHAPVVPLHVPAKPAWDTYGVWPKTHKANTCGDFSWREAAKVPLGG